MDFDKNKADILSREDKSKKGDVDDNIKELVDTINSLDNYFTTSSCAGRILIIKKSVRKKNDAEWLYTNHDMATFEEINKAVKNLPTGDTWFKQDPMILHIACRDLQSSRKILGKAREIGIKRSGIISLGRRIVVEIISTDNIETLLSRDGKLLFEESYLRILIEEANSNILKNKDMINRLCSKIKE